MIPRTCHQHTEQLPSQAETWRIAMREAITDPADLLEILELPKSRWLSGAKQAAHLFPLKVPKGYVARIKKSDPHDPLLRQVMPLTEETHTYEGFEVDPVGDQAATREPGLIQKYSGRALMITTGACAIHCRYCFRRHFPYRESHCGGQAMTAITTALQKDHSITEIILSGGDPLMLDDDALAQLMQIISNIDHIQRIRIHSRLPVVLPERITPSLLNTLTDSGKSLVMVIHCNHPQEIDERIDMGVAHAMQMLHEAGMTLLNQSVLLAGVNDDVESLATLSEQLFRHRVQPYYLHLLDRVQGAGHFEVAETAAQTLYQSLQNRLPGYLVPKMVREIPGMLAKSLILPA